MPDRDEVIKDAERSIAMLGDLEEPTPWCDFIRVSFEDTLALLREQEPVKPIIENGFSYCGVCGRSLDSDFADEEVFRFCPNCGRKVRQDAAD